MKTIRKTIELDMAILEARNEMNAVEKGGVNQGRKHVHVDNIVEEIEPYLYKYKLSVYSRRFMKVHEFTNQYGPQKEYKEYYETVIKHTPTGQKRPADVRPYTPEQGRGMNALQAQGCFETYVRRYALQGLFNLRGADDTDGVVPEKESSNDNKIHNYQNANKNKQDSHNNPNLYIDLLCNEIESLGLNLDETYKSFKTTRGNTRYLSPEAQKRLAVYLENILASLK